MLLISLYNESATGKIPFSDPKLASYFFHDFTSELINSVLCLSSLTKPEVSIKRVTSSTKKLYQGF